MPSGGTSKVWLMPWRPSTSASSTRLPWRDEGEREGGGHGRLADAALAGDDVQADTVHGAREGRGGHGIHPRWGRACGPDAARRTFDGPVSAW